MACLRTACRKIVAVGYNYAKHAEELGSHVPRDPVIFLKPSSCIITEGQSIRLPRGVKIIEHEVELGLVIGAKISKVDAFAAKEAIKGYVLALDMTDRAKQFSLMNAKLPIDIAKGFDTACPISRFIDAEDVKDPEVSYLKLL